MEIALPVFFALLAMVEVGSALARSAPPEWALGELILLAGSYVLARECKKLWIESREDKHSKARFAGDTERFTEPSGNARNGRHWIFEQAASGPPAGGNADIRASYSVEQVALAMVTHAFRQLSLKHHPDHGGDPEIMRRIYAAREIMLRTIGGADETRRIKKQKRAGDDADPLE